MRTNFRRLFFDVLIYGSGDFLLRATAFLTMPIYTRIFNPEDYGIWSYIGTLLSLLVTIVGLGSTNVSNRFFFDAKQPHEKQQMVSTWFGFMAVWTTGIVVLLLPFAAYFSHWAFETPTYSNLFVISLLSVPITLINTLSGQLLRDQFRAKLSTVLNLVATLLIILVTLLLVVVFNLGLLGLALGNLLAVLIILPVRIWTARALLRPLFSVALLRRMLIFGAPLVPMAIAYWIFNVSDTILLGKLSTFEQVGLYGVAAKLTLALTLVNSAFGQAWAPRALHLYANQPEEARLFFGQVLTYLLIGFGLLGVGLIVFAPELLVILTAPAFYGATAAIPPLVFAAIALASTQITALSISLTQKTYYFTIFSAIAALINISLNFVFIPRWGMVAAGWTTAVAYVFLTVAYFFISQRLWAIVYDMRKTITVVALILGFGIGATLLGNLHALVFVPVKLIYCVVYILSLFLFQVLGQREWNVVGQLKQTIWVRASSSL